MFKSNFENSISKALSSAIETSAKLAVIQENYTKDATVGNIMRVLMELPQEKCNEVLCYAGFLLEKIKNPEEYKIKKTKDGAK